MVKIRLLKFYFLTILFFGCASTKTNLTQYKLSDKAFKKQDYTYAISRIKEAKDKYYKHKDRVLFYLDLGMLYHFNKQYKLSNQFLTNAEYVIEELFTKSISKAGLSILLNDNAKEYQAEDYEDIYINIFKALNYIHLKMFDDAFVEINRVNHKLNMLEDKHRKIDNSYNKSKDKKIEFKTGKNRFYNDALARYISLLLYRADGKWDNAEIDRKKIYEAFALQSQLYTFSPPKMENILKPTTKVKTTFISFVGRSPVKQSKTLYIHTEKNVAIVATSKTKPIGEKDLTYLDAFFWYGLEDGYHFKFDIPQMIKSETNVANIMLVDSFSRTVFEPIEDIGDIALETFKTRLSRIYIKTISRTITKSLLAKKMSDKVEKNYGGVVGKLTSLALSATSDATENADLRVSRYFPQKAFIAEVELEPGIHNLKVQYFNENERLIFTDYFPNISIKKNSLNIFESYYPR